VENEETLETSAVVSQLADSVENEVDHFLANGVVTTGVVASGIFLARNELLRVEQLSVGAGADFIDDSGLEIDENSAGNVLASASLAEEGVEGIITSANGFVRRHLTIRLNAVLQAEQLPAGVTDLATGLTNVNANSFSHGCCKTRLEIL
jgi:hypothetical protein